MNNQQFIKWGLELSNQEYAGRLECLNEVMNDYELNEGFKSFGFELIKEVN